jgi:hypothetical protein
MNSSIKLVKYYKNQNKNQQDSQQFLSEAPEQQAHSLFLLADFILAVFNLTDFFTAFLTTFFFAAIETQLLILCEANA